MKDSISSIAVGATGFASSEVASIALPAGDGGTADVVTIVVQIIIGIATLLGLFRKKN